MYRLQCVSVISHSLDQLHPQPQFELPCICGGRKPVAFVQIRERNENEVKMYSSKIWKEEPGKVPVFSLVRRLFSFSENRLMCRIAHNQRVLQLSCSIHRLRSAWFLFVIVSVGDILSDERECAVFEIMVSAILTTTFVSFRVATLNI